MIGHKKRTFKSLGHAIDDLSQLLRRPAEMAAMVTGLGEVSPALREKIMLAVTSVNRCRYCTFVHTHLALREGLSYEKIGALLDGELATDDEEEREIILYSQHWADTGGHPDEAVRARFLETHGRRRTEAIETAIRAIMFGNYFGNTFDALLFKVSPSLAQRFLK